MAEPKVVSPSRCEPSSAMDGLAGPTDPQFCLALDYFLRDRGWTIQRFCDLAAEKPANGLPIVHPHNFSDWRSRSHPSNKSILAVCQVLGVSRSRFFKVAEQLWQLHLVASRSEEESDREVEQMRMTVASLRGPDALERLSQLEEAIRRQKAKLRGPSPPEVLTVGGRSC